MEEGRAAVAERLRLIQARKRNAFQEEVASTRNMLHNRSMQKMDDTDEIITSFYEKHYYDGGQWEGGAYEKDKETIIERLHKMEQRRKDQTAALLQHYREKLDIKKKAAKYRPTLGERRSKQLKRRWKLALEVLATEKSFCAGLDTLMTVYRRPMIDRAGKSLPMSVIDVENIFKGLPEILMVNERMCEKLSVVLNEATWSHDSVLGPVFIKYIPQMRDFYASYASRLPSVVDRLEVLSVEKAAVQQQLMEMSQDPRSMRLDLNAHLLTPVQRILRYKMLLTELHKYTPDDHTDAAEIKRAVEIIAEVAMHVNEKKRACEETIGVKEAAARIKNIPHSVDEPGRTLIAEVDCLEVLDKPKLRGARKQLSKVVSGQVALKRMSSGSSISQPPSPSYADKTMTIFLFNDQIVFAKKKSKSRKSDGPKSGGSCEFLSFLAPLSVVQVANEEVEGEANDEHARKSFNITTAADGKKRTFAANERRSKTNFLAGWARLCKLGEESEASQITPRDRTSE